MGKTKKQHYVPQTYLRRFASEQGQIWVYDKKSGKEYRANVADVAQERYFYDLPAEFEAEGTDVQAAEKVFGIAEATFQATLDQILQKVERDGLTPDDRRKLVQYLAAQWVRTRAFRDSLLEVLRKSGQALSNRLVERTDPDAPRELYPTFAVPEEAEPVWHFEQMFSTRVLYDIADALTGYIWMVGVNDHDQPLYTSDCPVVRQGHVNDLFIGGRGIHALGAEFAYPLTPRHVLILRDRRHFKSDQQHEDRPVPLSREEVDRLNRLQVVEASRQVYSSSEALSFARDVCKAEPDIISPARERFDVFFVPAIGDLGKDYLVIVERSRNVDAGRAQVDT